jgi:SAM-dependent methyltransferase
LPEYDPLAGFFDLEYAHDYDLPFWLALARREGGPVVEWGAGTGRLSLPLSEVGFDVTAVETSKAMIEKGHAKEGAADVEWLHGDMRRVKLGRRHRLGICAFNSFLCLTSQEDALAFLRNAREHLESNGLLGIEVSSFSPEELAEVPGTPALRHDFARELPQGESLERFSISRYDAATQLLWMRLFYELYDREGKLKDKQRHKLAIRPVGRGELELMLRLAGFGVEAVYGRFEGEPFTAESEHLVALARPL